MTLIYKKFGFFGNLKENFNFYLFFGDIKTHVYVFF